jgi:hypothetical protein
MMTSYGVCPVLRDETEEGAEKFLGTDPGQPLSKNKSRPGERNSLLPYGLVGNIVGTRQAARE